MNLVNLFPDSKFQEFDKNAPLPKTGTFAVCRDDFMLLQICTAEQLSVVISNFEDVRLLYGQVPDNTVVYKIHHKWDGIVILSYSKTIAGIIDYVRSKMLDILNTFGGGPLSISTFNTLTTRWGGITVYICSYGIFVRDDKYKKLELWPLEI